MARDFAKQFYHSPEWHKVRKAVLMRDNYLCVRCGAPAEEVHHKTHLTPKNIGDNSITIGMDNLVSLCRDCHFEQHRIDFAEAVAKSNQRRVHKRIVNKDGTYFDDDGYIKKRMIHIVYGAPCAGKTTYVLNHKQEHDIVIDLDRIMGAITLDDKRYKDNPALPLAEAIRQMLYSLIEKRSETLDCKNVWVIAGLPIKKEREELAERLGADLIKIDISKQDAIKRSIELDRYGDKTYSRDIVEYYFYSHEGW